MLLKGMVDAGMYIIRHNFDISFKIRLLLTVIFAMMRYHYTNIFTVNVYLFILYIIYIGVYVYAHIHI